jgi:hypothetical protein
MKSLYFLYDQAHDVLHVGIACYEICGDADADRNASHTSSVLESLGGIDVPGLRGGESIVLLVDPNPLAPTEGGIVSPFYPQWLAGKPAIPTTAAPSTSPSEPAASPPSNYAVSQVAPSSPPLESPLSAPSMAEFGAEPTTSLPPTEAPFDQSAPIGGSPYGNGGVPTWDYAEGGAPVENGPIVEPPNANRTDGGEDQGATLDSTFKMYLLDSLLGDSNSINFSFGSIIPNTEVYLAGDPMNLPAFLTNDPPRGDFEFSIRNFSTLPGLERDSTGAFNLAFAVYAGSLDDANIPYDVIPDLFIYGMR